MNRRSFLALPFVSWFASRFEDKAIRGARWNNFSGWKCTDPLSAKLKPGEMLNVPVGRKYHGGSIVIHPSPTDLDLWLPRILGG